MHTISEKTKNKQNLKFTVITVTLNAEKVISKTIESILNQSYSPYEYMIIDGLSMDKTVEIAESYRSLFSAKKINYIIKSEKDSGIYNAMNKGIEAASGDFISFLNAGDWYQEDSLYKINQFYQDEPFDLTYGGLNYIYPNGTSTIKMSKPDQYFVTSRHWNHPSMFLRREIYQKYGFDEYFRNYADFDLYLKLRKDGTKIRVIPEVITNFVADGISTNYSPSKTIQRAKEKYISYRNNSYSCLNWFESYGWEILKSIILRIKS